MSDAGSRYEWAAIWDHYGEEIKMRYEAYRREGHRRGQAFLNAIPETDSRFLVERGLSPFYSDEDEAVFEAFKNLRHRHY